MSNTVGGIEHAAEARHAFCTVNPHCLEAILRLAQETDVVATCAVVDEDGTRLLESGTLISPSFHETLLSRRLRTPLEASLGVAQGASLEDIVGDCLRLMCEVPALALLGAGAEGALRALGGMPLPAPLKLLLTLARSLRQGNYQNSLAAMIVASGLAQGTGLNAYDTQLLILAALVQDVGESYLDPALLDGHTPLPVEQWQSVAAHPLVGQAFLGTFTPFPPALADCVLQHHERQDGSGYPFQRQAATMSPLGTLIGLADCVAAVVMGSRAPAGFTHDFNTAAESYSSVGERVVIALSIVPGEFPVAAVDFVVKALEPFRRGGAGIIGGNFAQRILPTLQQIRAARLFADELSLRTATPALARIGDFTLSAIRLLDKRLRLTGVYDIAQLGVLESDPLRMGRTCLVLDEVRWRLRHLARSVHLQAQPGGVGTELAQVARMVAVLADPGA